jgi:hypothetical protein
LTGMEFARNRPGILGLMTPTQLSVGVHEIPL